MNDAVTWAGAPLAGAVLGLLFFGGLWWTIRKLPRMKRPGLWLVTSFVLRAAVVVVGFWAVMQGNPLRVLLAMAGFLAVRFILLRSIGRPFLATPR